MANLHSEFLKYHDEIALTAGRKSALQSVRDTLRQRIRNYFRNTLRVEAPKFRWQGSCAINTVVNPIHNEYGSDDGVYLQHLDKEDAGNWPTAATIHQWLVNAADGHANERPMEKRACVRIQWAGQYHINLYAYGELNGQYLLAVKREARWPRSDPPAFTNWFKSYVHQRGEQLRRIVRYFKAWADYQSMRRGEMDGGLILTVLAAHHFHSHARDDIALVKTIEGISDTVRTEFFVLNPVDISEELTARLSAAQKENFKNAVQAFADLANGALAIEDAYKASKLCRKLFGDRFPLGIPRK